jgi:ATP-dependent RNA helicase DeaD
MMNLETFAGMGLSTQILEALRQKGFEEPTPIQEQIIPLLMSQEQDLVGQAQTGTGKTAAFGIPMLEKLKFNGKDVQALILVPTRELAIQVAEEINTLKGSKKLQIVPIYGGQSISLQINKLRRGVDIVVGTPGRILDHLRRRVLNLAKVSTVVLDEADEMLNMGFIEDVKQILNLTNADRTTLLFSATMPREIMKIAQQYMKSYKMISIQPEKPTVSLTDQIYFEVAESDKFEALCRIIDVEDQFYGLVFCRTKVDTARIADHLQNRGYDAAALHGDLTQAQREQILHQFRKKKATILVATDVAARGLDVQHLSHVINYAIPQGPEAYVHRIGRTGRAGREGTAITFITPKEYIQLKSIKRGARTDIRKEKLPGVGDIIEAKKERIKREMKKMSQVKISEEFLRLARELLAENEPDVVMASILKYTFRDELDPGSYNEIRDAYPPIKGKTRLFVAMGKKDRLTPRQLVNFIEKKARIDQQKIDDVQVMDTYSFITVPFLEAEKILKTFKKVSRGQRPVVERASRKKESKK